jgi:hypothetical protein
MANCFDDDSREGIGVLEGNGESPPGAWPDALYEMLDRSKEFAEGVEPNCELRSCDSLFMALMLFQWRMI